MRDAASSIADQILGRVQIASEAASAEFRRAIVKALTSLYDRYRDDPDEFRRRAIQVVRRLIRASADVHAGMLTDVQIAGWIHGAIKVADKLPRELPTITPPADVPLLPPRPRSVTGGGSPPNVPLVYPAGDDGPTIRLPKLDEAARDLAERRLVRPEDFYSQVNAYRRQALFTVSRFEDETIARVQKILVETVQEGPSLTEFESKLDDALITSPLGPGHLENVFQTNTMTAIVAGEDQLLANPAIGNTFPYAKRLPIRDARLTKLCKILAVSGIQGSAIYHRSDPMYELFRRPSHFQCRCGEAYYTVREAARAGLEHAIEWLERGDEPSWKPFVPFPELDAESLKTWESWRRHRAAG